MFGLFKKKGKKENQPQIVDLHNNPLQVGDLVMSLRYELGKCKVVKDGDMLFYESLENGKRVSWVKMIDAVTAFQKVEKINPVE